MSKPNTAWRGAIEFAGFPVNIALYSRVKKQRTQSFRTIAPSGQPMAQGKPVDTGTGKTYASSESRKGVEVAKGQFAILTEEAIEQINSGVKTTVATPEQFVPVDTIDLSLAIDRYAVRPDDKAAGSDQSVNIIWNGLRATDKAYVTQVSLTGGHDAVLVIWADDRGMWAAMLPFVAELYDVPTHEFVENEQAAALFEQVLDGQYAEQTADAFEHEAFESEYIARREAAIAQVIEGVEVTVDAPAAQKSGAPDLMAVLAAVADTTTHKAKPKAKAKKVAA